MTPFFFFVLLFPIANGQGALNGLDVYVTFAFIQLHHYYLFNLFSNWCKVEGLFAFQVLDGSLTIIGTCSGPFMRLFCSLIVSFIMQARISALIRSSTCSSKHRLIIILTKRPAFSALYPGRFEYAAKCFAFPMIFAGCYQQRAQQYCHLSIICSLRARTGRRVPLLFRNYSSSGRCCCL